MVLYGWIVSTMLIDWLRRIAIWFPNYANRLSFQLVPVKFNLGLNMTNDPKDQPQAQTTQIKFPRLEIAKFHQQHTKAFHQ